MRPSADDPAGISDRIWAGWYGKLAFDVGGNCGQTIPLMQAKFDRVVSFEPHVEAHLWACEHQPGAEIVNAAVSDHDGVIMLAQLGGVQADTGQLVTPGTMGMEWQPDDWLAVDLVECRCFTLDTLASKSGFGRPDFVKIDTEGHELKVLLGGTGLLHAGLTDFLIEFHAPSLHEACSSLLEAADYKVEVVRHPHYPVGSPMYFQHGWLRATAPKSGDTSH